MLDNKCGKYEEPSSQTDCGDYALFVPSTYNGTGKNLCVSKYNMGDTNGPSIPSDYHQLSPGDGNVCTKDNYKCYWVGQTAKTNNAKTKANYSATTRTIFSTYDTSTTGANLCKGWSYLGLNRSGYYWRLPTSVELDAWASAMKASSDTRLNIFGYKGLDFCTDDSEKSEFSRCDSRPDVCKTNGGNNNCNPYGIMGDSLQYKNNDYRRYRLIVVSGNNLYKTSYTTSNMTSISVRCVSDMVFKK